VVSQARSHEVVQNKVTWLSPGACLRRLWDQQTQGESRARTVVWGGQWDTHFTYK
jgi:hypothetical protein